VEMTSATQEGKDKLEPKRIRSSPEGRAPKLKDYFENREQGVGSPKRSLSISKTNKESSKKTKREKKRMPLSVALPRKATKSPPS